MLEKYNDMIVNQKKDPWKLFKMEDLNKFGTKKYEKNSCIFFINNIDSLHKVSERFGSKYHRNFVSLNLYKCNDER